VCDIEKFVACKGREIQAIDDIEDRGYIVGKKVRQGIGRKGRCISSPWSDSAAHGRGRAGFKSWIGG
jgi:hypothetical protein